jgi:hypothetical protein
LPLIKSIGAQTNPAYVDAITRNYKFHLAPKAGVDTTSIP